MVLKKNKHIKNIPKRTLMNKIREDEDFMVSQNKIAVYENIKVCDITGLPADYYDPKSTLRYFDASIYKYIKIVKMDGAICYLNLKDKFKSYNKFRY